MRRSEGLLIFFYKKEFCVFYKKEKVFRTMLDKTFFNGLLILSFMGNTFENDFVYTVDFGHYLKNKPHITPNINLKKIL